MPRSRAYTNAYKNLTKSVRRRKPLRAPNGRFATPAQIIRWFGIGKNQKT